MTSASVIQGGSLLKWVVCWPARRSDNKIFKTSVVKAEKQTKRGTDSEACGLLKRSFVLEPGDADIEKGL